MGLSAIITTAEVAAVSTTFAALSGSTQTAFLNGACSVADGYVGRRLDTAADTEYYDGSRDMFLNLKRWPVTAISEVKHDLQGGFGQIPTSFGADTVLVQGTDYILDMNCGMITLLTNTRAANWFVRGYPLPYAGRNYGRGLVANYTPASWGQAPGSVKVTYTAGYTSGNKPTELVSAIAQIATYLDKINNTGGQTAASQSYIDTSQSFHVQTVIDQMRGGIPALGSARQILDNYRSPVVGTGWVM
jgi:hypothetical protein